MGLRRIDASPELASPLPLGRGEAPQSHLALARRACAARLRARTIWVGVRIIGLADEEGIGDAGEISARRGGLTLRVRIERAIAQTRIFVALQTERMIGADSACRSDVEQRERDCGSNEDRSESQH